MASKPKAAPLPSLADMADELGQLHKNYAIAIAPFEQQLVRMKALEKAIQLACPAKATDEWIAEGTRFGVRLSPCANERKIDFKKLLKRISPASFVKFATCTLKALEQNVSLDVFQEVVTEAQAGPRKLSTFEKGHAATA